VSGKDEPFRCPGCGEFWDALPRGHCYGLPWTEFLRALSLSPVAAMGDEGFCPLPGCPNFGGVWRDCPR
jgi:hypothetical protein